MHSLCASLYFQSFYFQCCFAVTCTLAPANGLVETTALSLLWTSNFPNSVATSYLSLLYSWSHLHRKVVHLRAEKHGEASKVSVGVANITWCDDTNLKGQQRVNFNLPVRCTQFVKEERKHFFHTKEDCRRAADANYWSETALSVFSIMWDRDSDWSVFIFWMCVTLLSRIEEGKTSVVITSACFFLRFAYFFSNAKLKDLMNPWMFGIPEKQNTFHFVLDLKKSICTNINLWQIYELSFCPSVRVSFCRGECMEVQAHIPRRRNEEKQDRQAGRSEWKWRWEGEQRRPFLLRLSSSGEVRTF